MKKLPIVTGCMFAALLSGIVVFSATAEEKEKKVPLKIDLPEALFIGTPKTINSPNLDKNYKPPVIMVPEGTKNLAKDKPVTSSDSMPIIGELELVTDDDREGSDGSYVELAPEKQWVQIDLEKKSEIYAVGVWHYHSQARVYYDVVIQISDDPDFAEKVTTIFNNDHDNSSGLGKGSDKEYIETNKGLLVGVKNVTGRYVRLYSNGNTDSDINHYIEVEVHGKKAK